MKMQVRAHETGLVRVFALDLPPQEAAGFATSPDTPEAAWPLRDALGAEVLDPEWVDLVQPGDLGELGLAGYLTQGLGVAEAELDGARDRLTALDTPVVILPSRAFRGAEQTLAPRKPLRWIGTFREEAAAPVTERLQSDSALGQPGPSGSASDLPPPAGRPAWIGTALLAAGVLVCLALIYFGLEGRG